MSLTYRKKQLLVLFKGSAIFFVVKKTFLQNTRRKSPLNSVGGVGSVGSWVTCVEILVWVARANKILTRVKKRRECRGSKFWRGCSGSEAFW